MKFLASALPFGGLGLLGGLLKQKKPHVAAPSPVPTRDDAQAAAERQTELLRRRGGAADMVTGVYGAEAGPGGKTMLGS